MQKHAIHCNSNLLETTSMCVEREFIYCIMFQLLIVLIIIFGRQGLIYSFNTKLQQMMKHLLHPYDIRAGVRYSYSV